MIFFLESQVAKMRVLGWLDAFRAVKLALQHSLVMPDCGWDSSRFQNFSHFKATQNCIFVDNLAGGVVR